MSYDINDFHPAVVALACEDPEANLSVPAYVLGCWAAVREYGYYYSITHIPTGLRFLAMLRLDDALTCIDELHYQDIDWRVGWFGAHGDDLPEPQQSTLRRFYAEWKQRMLSAGAYIVKSEVPS